MKRSLVVVIVIVCAVVAVQSPSVTRAQVAPATAPSSGGFGGQGPRGQFRPIQIGPPAPVPPQVAMARPTTQELTQINEAVEKFIDSDTSPTKPLLEKYR